MLYLHGAHSSRPAQFCPRRGAFPSNVHDSVMFKNIYDKVKAAFPEIKYVVANAGYKIPYICKQIPDDHRVPVLPYITTV